MKDLDQELNGFFKLFFQQNSEPGTSTSVQGKGDRILSIFDLFRFLVFLSTFLIPGKRTELNRQYIKIQNNQREIELQKKKQTIEK